MRTSLFLKTGAELLAQLEARVGDSSNELASETQYTAGISEGITMWATRVIVPHIYSFDFSEGTYEYTLPSYIRPPFVLQIRETLFGPFGIQLDADSVFTYENVVGYDVEPTSTGGFQIRLQSVPYAETGHLIYWTENGPLPASAPTLTSTISSTATSAALTVSSSPDLNDAGYVKIESEWLSYGGLTRTSATSYTISNLTRGLYGTTAASHNSATAVSWGVAADDNRLWVQLLDYATAYAHALQMHKTTTEDMSRHEKLMGYYGQKADAFWRLQGYLSQRKPKLKLGRNALGPLTW